MAITPEKLAALRAKAASNRLQNIGSSPAAGINNTTEVVTNEVREVITADESRQLESRTCDDSSNMLNLPSNTDTLCDVTKCVGTADGTTDCNTPNTVDLTPQQYIVVEKIEMIKSLLQQQNPMMETLLKQVHTALKRDPELIHFLQPDQIGAVVKGCMEVAKVVIVAASVKKTTTVAGKKLSQLTLSDI